MSKVGCSLPLLCVLCASVVNLPSLVGVYRRASAVPVSSISGSSTALRPVSYFAPTTRPAVAPTWLADFTEAGRRSRLEGKPLLVRSNRPDCPDCRALDRTLADPGVAARLAEFVLCEFDVSESPGPARDLDIGQAPALALLSAEGVCVGRHVGPLPPAELLAWLESGIRKIEVLRPEVLYEDPKDLVALLATRDPVLREGATTALASQVQAGLGEETVPAVVEAFAAGPLSLRLGALELLRMWGAPIEGVDPWKPGTVPPALERLRAWAKTVKPGAETRRPSPEEIGRDLDLWMTADDGPVTRAAYERLARIGPTLLLRVRELVPPTWERRRERLAALTYRILLPRPVALRLPAVPFQLAARDPALRVQALAALADDVTRHGNGQALQEAFLEAFADPDPRVRETALRGLRSAGAAFAREHVLRFLDDPSANVRVTVLNDLMETPLPDLAADLAAYAARETDEDLLVHAARAMRPLRDDAAVFAALIKLTEHASWRVRAEAVASFGSVTTRAGRLGDLSADKQPALARTVERALRDDDAFVVAKAIELLHGLEALEVKACVEALVAAIEKHPELTLPALGAMTGVEGMRSLALPHVRRLCTHADAAVRAAAIHALVMNTEAPMVETILAGLADGEPRVRASAASSLAEWAHRYEWHGGARKPVIPAEPRGRLLTAVRALVSEKDAALRRSAATALAALGDAEVAFPVLKDLVRDDAHASAVASVVPLLDWPKRRELFADLGGRTVAQRTWAEMFEAVFRGAPAEAEPLLWATVESDPHVLASPREIIDVIRSYCGVDRYGWNDPETTAMNRLRLTAPARRLLASASPPRQVMGLALLCDADRDAGEMEAKRLVEAAAGAGVHDDLRRAATEVLLWIGPPKYESAIIAALSGEDPRLRLTALQSLARGVSASYATPSVHVGEEPVWLAWPGGDFWSSTSEARAWTPPALASGLTASLIRPFLKDEDESVWVGAAYLLALLGEADGLEALVRGWRADKDDYRLCLLLPRAVAALGRDDDLQVLEEFYEAVEPDERASKGKTLYWTIRRMEGPRAKALRSRIRADIGVRIFTDY